MATRKGITPDQLKQASASLGLTVAAIAEGAGLSKAYISEFRSGTRSLKPELQAKLRDYLQKRCAAAGVDFPEDEPADDDAEAGRQLGPLAGLVRQVTRPAILLSDDIPKAQAQQLLKLIDGNLLKLGEVLDREFSQGGSLLGGDFSADTAKAIQEAFALLATNYLAILLLQGRCPVRKVTAAEFEPQTVGDWLSQHMANFPIGNHLPEPDEQPDEATAGEGA